MILEEETFEAFGYRPSALSHGSAKPVLAACDLCGNVRKMPKCRYRALCMSCVQRGKHRTEESRHKQSISTKGNRNHFFDKKHTPASCVLISKNRNYTRGGEHPAWIPRAMRTCLMCGLEFRVENYRLKYGQGKYCCKSCAAKARRHTVQPTMTAPEKAFEGICLKYSLPFKFVGDGSLWLGNANPDFVHIKKKIVVEVFGDYWHSPLLRPKLRYNEAVEGRRKQFKAEGYKTIIIWESDLKREDAEAYVMHLLKKEKVV